MPCPGKEMNEPVPKRSKHDDVLVVDVVPTNSSNQVTGSGKRELKPQKRKIARKPGQKSWKQIEVNEIKKLEEKNSEVYDFLLKHWSSIRTFSRRGPMQDVLNFYCNKKFQILIHITLEQILKNQPNF